jgi:uncharacterized membrane protein
MAWTLRTSGHRNQASLPSDRASVALFVSGAITALTLGTAFGLLALEVEHFWVVFPLGFGVVLPTAIGVVIHTRTTTETQDTKTGESDSRNPLEDLRTRYARGEISEEEFERRLDHLIESEEIQ